MFVKKYEAPSLEQALSLVKSELGPNALILSTETKAKRWFNKPMVEVTAASEKKAESPPHEENTFDEEALREIFPHRRSKFSDDSRPHTQPPAPVKKSKVERYQDNQPPSASSPAPKQSANTLHPFEELFLRSGFSLENAKDFSRQLIFDYSKQDLKSPAFLEKAKLRLISPALKTLTASIFRSQPDWAFIGTAGAGKTSSLVKLALFLKTQEQKVAVFSHDMRKLLGKRELSAYARMIDVPYLEGAPSIKDRHDVSLHDCPSLPLTGHERMDELETACANRSVCLVIDASIRLPEMIRIYERATRFRPVAVNFTRFDGLVAAGVIHDFLKQTKLAVLGASLSESFKTPFKFFEPTELGRFILKS